jgi:hypothetical protein
VNVGDETIMKNQLNELEEYLKKKEKNKMIKDVKF